MRSFSIPLFGTLLCASLAVSIGLAQSALADVHLPAIESDNMVLQAGVGPQLYGSASPGEEIAIKYGHRQISTKTDNFGQWRVRLPHLKAGEKFDIEVKGKNTLAIKNVLVGEVWLCSGQSNMEFPLARANDHAKEVGQANHEQLRLFKVERRLATAPAADVQGSWKVCTPATVADFSAVGYFFGRALSQDLKTPVGLIESSWGGTPAQVWTSLDGLEADPVTQKRYWVMAKEHLAKLHQMSETYDKEMADWKLIAEKIAAEKSATDKAGADKANTDKKDDKADKENPPKAVAEKSPLPAPPAKPSELEFPHAPSMLYNAMIAPLTAYTIGGVIWYQGESNANAADETMAYRHLFPALIKDWRQKFGLPKLPFLYVQLANFEKREDANVRSPWAELREAQLLTLKVPNTGMAVAVDIGEEKDIHPKNKLDVGLRLERIALAEVYGRKIPFSGPIFSGMTVKGNQAICTFKYTDRGLKAKGGKLVGFTICGPDKKFVPADAEIVGNTVHVSSPNVAAPSAVRYAWAGDPLNNLYNGADFPASPFRSDVTPEPAVVELPVTK
jgi:sialate O-acetylesterase